MSARVGRAAVPSRRRRKLVDRQRLLDVGIGRIFGEIGLATNVARSGLNLRVACQP